MESSLVREELIVKIIEYVVSKVWMTQMFSGFMHQ